MNGMERDQMNLPPQLQVLIAKNEGTVDIGVLVRYATLIDRAERASEALRGGVTAFELVEAADRYRLLVTPALSAYSRDDGNAPRGSNGPQRVAALNVGLRSGLELEHLSHHCLYNTPVDRLIQDATESTFHTTAHFEELLCVDENLRGDPQITYTELVDLHGADLPVTETYQWLKRWATRRSFDSPDRRITHRGVVDTRALRDEILFLWNAEKDDAARVGRKPSKAAVWLILCNKAEQIDGESDAMTLTIDGVAVAKMTFYQWLHRGNKP